MTNIENQETTSHEEPEEQYVTSKMADLSVKKNSIEKYYLNQMQIHNLS